MPSAKKSKPSPSRGVPVPEARRRAAKQVLKLLEPGMRVALMTHVNADGDGAGSEIALWHLLTRRGVRAAITNPTPFPERFGFLLDKAAGADKSPSGVKYLERADAIVVLDIADLDRLGHLSRVVAKAKIPVACIDHHLSDGTGELVYDLARSARWELTPQVARALYVAILTDTGGFRFSNTTPRTLQVAAHLLERGLDAEQIYREVYASEPEGKIRLLGEVLETLVVEPGHQLAWVTVPPGAMQRHGVDASDLDGVVEFARAVRGVDLAILFRELANGRIKVSFRSVGDVDVAKMAESFGGGGHRRAAGASLEGTLDEVQARVLEAARSVARP
jgi:phosphoesterase RecJ-like protein